MSRNPLASKLAIPYARALYDYSVEHNVTHIITAKCLEFTYTGEYIVGQTKDEDGNPLIIMPTTKSIVYENGNIRSYFGLFFLNDEEHFGKFLTVLYKRNRFHLVPEICTAYVELVSKIASIKTVEVSTAFPFTTVQKLNLIKKLKELTNAREIRLVITVDSTLIGGFLIKLDSNILDFTIKNQLENLAKKLNWSRGIENLEQWIEN